MGYNNVHFGGGLVFWAGLRGGARVVYRQNRTAKIIKVPEL